MVLKRVGVISCAKMAGTVYGLIGVLVGGVFALVSTLGLALGRGEFSQRQLVAIWYLNDVRGPGGETEFALQDVKVTPQAGKLVLFPPFWTHIHRAVEVQSTVKYIATTWICFA